MQFNSQENLSYSRINKRRKKYERATNLQFEISCMLVSAKQNCARRRSPCCNNNDIGFPTRRLPSALPRFPKPPPSRSISIRVNNDRFCRRIYAKLDCSENQTLNVIKEGKKCAKNYREIIFVKLAEYEVLSRQ
jgi:hypothetical protein